MTYQEYKNHLKVCELLGKPLTGKYAQIHETLTYLWDSTSLRTSPGSGLITIHKGNKRLFTMDTKYHITWCENDIWDLFRNIIGQPIKFYINIQYFLKDMLSEHLMCEPYVVMSGTTQNTDSIVPQIPGLVNDI